MDYEKLPATVQAPHPHDRSRWIELRPSRTYVQVVAKQRRINDIYALFYNVMGVLPPVNNVGKHENFESDDWGGLRAAVSLFRGVRRPFNGDGMDRDVYVYIVRPRYVYEYLVDMVCVARRAQAPQGAVFAVYVKFDDAITDGTIIGAEWVEASLDDPALPADFSRRYDKKVW